MKKSERRYKKKRKNMIKKQQPTKTSSKIKATEEAGEIFEESMNWLKHKITETTDIERVVIRKNSPAKMSDTLLEYAEPFLETIGYEKAVELAMMVWNYAIAQENPVIGKEIKEILKPVMPDAASKSIVNYMLERKRQMFPDNKRMILHYDLVETPEGFHLSVMSMPPQ